MPTHKTLVTSGKEEWYSPAFVVSAARLTMGGIDLDPASCFFANEKIVKAGNFFDIHANGLLQQWEGSVWLNHPFSRKNNPLWINKLVSEFVAKRITQAICITYASTGAGWFKPLHLFPQCYFYKRVNYIDPETLKPKTGVQKDSVVTYLGKNTRAFYQNFSEFGSVKVPFVCGL